MRRTNQVLGGRIRTPQDESDLLMTNQDPGKQITASQNESGSHRTNHGLPWWTRDLKPDFCCFPFNIFLFLYLILGHYPKNSGSNPRTFQFWGYPGLGHFAKLAFPKTDGWIRQCSSCQGACNDMRLDLFRPIRDLDLGWPEVKITKWPFGGTKCVRRSALTRERRWWKNQCSTYMK